ncbi:MAG: class I SAM-dependent methyltransferase, partial [Nitrospirota bacterium]
MNAEDRISCPFCKEVVHGKALDNIQKNGEIYAVFYCRGCRVGFTVPKPSAEDISELYSTGSYRIISGKRFHIFFEFLIYLFRYQRKKRVEKFKKGGRIVDIGCGRGLFLHIMRRNGWDVLGVELNDETAAYAREKYGIKIKTGSALNWSIPDGSVDVIALNHVLEHVDDPPE